MTYASKDLRFAWLVLLFGLLVVASGCVPVASGLTVEEPEVSKMGPPPKLKTLTPTFRWQPYDPGSSAAAKMTDLRYHLLVTMRKSDTDREQTVIDKNDLVGTSYTPTEPLQNRRQYVWSVRPEYKSEGKLTEGEWAGYRHIWYVGFAAGFSGRNSYAFETAAP